jgi:uncharacterized membrane protein YadS
VIFALAMGLIVSHLGGASASIRAAARSELFIKTGLVIMGATILFADVVAAVVLSTWWAMRHSTGQETSSTGIGVIWQRFPKFVIGFVAASVVFSFVLTPAMVDQTKGAIGSVRTIWFALAFVAIGLEARVSDLLTLDEGRPLVAFVLAQTFNVAWTLLLAWLIFGGIVFPTITM